MTNRYLATLLLGLLGGLSMSSAASAASTAALSRADLDAMQAQIQALTQRLDRLEAVNERLQAENASLKAQDAAPVAVASPGESSNETRAAAAPGVAERLEAVDWAGRLKLRGDVRYRHEHLAGEQVVDGRVEDAADRDRHRLRARVALDATVTESLQATVALSTGGDDPRGSNATLGGTSDREDFMLDLAYADWRFMDGGHLLLGKQPYPVWRPSYGMFFDSDVNPEGAALRFERDGVFANAYGYWLTEQFDTDRNGDNTDSGIFGLQAGLEFDALGGETRLAAHYYVCGACKDHSPLYANNANGNTTYQVGAANVLRYGYEVLDLSAQLRANLGNWPLTLTGGYARNLASGVDYDTAYALGAHLGRLGDRGTWEAGVLYQSIDKDALFGQIVDSDFGNGYTDSNGWVLKAGYVPVKNVALNATMFFNTMNKDVGTELDVTRLQLDVNFKF